uniref:Uncharacterized protein n=1 Tax=Rhipicephalus appendiculatus TaxID=34631 RepID=A0A131YUA0_RHIAP
MKPMLPLFPQCFSGHCSFFVLFIASLHIFAAFTIFPVFVLMQHFIDEAQESDDSHDISIVHKFAQLHDSFYRCVNFVWWEKLCEYSVQFVAN